MQESQLRKAQHEKSIISMSMSKLHALNHWKRSITDGSNKMQVEKLNQELTKYVNSFLTIGFPVCFTHARPLLV